MFVLSHKFHMVQLLGTVSRFKVNISRGRHVVLYFSKRIMARHPELYLLGVFLPKFQDTAANDVYFLPHLRSSRYCHVDIDGGYQSNTS